MKLHAQQGSMYIYTLGVFFTIASISGIFLLRSVNASKSTQIATSSLKAYIVGQGAAQAALRQVDTLINSYLLTTLSNTSPSGVINYATSKVASGDGIGWLVYSTRNNNVAVLTQNGEQAEYSGSGTLATGTYQFNIIITEKSDPTSAGADAWDFPFSYKVLARGISAGQSNDIATSGDFTVRVQRDNFAKFALFTNDQTTPSGTNVWFTDKTNFSGPVHTNTRFNFALNPSGTFTDAVTQHYQTARFYNSGSSLLLDASSNGTKDVPVFQDSFTRDEDFVTLSSATQQTDMVTQAKGSNTYSTNGIYIPNSGGNLTAGIYVRGDSNISMSINGSQQAVYTITQGATTKTVTVDRTNNQTIVQDSSGTTTYAGLPDGQDDAGTLIYVEGDVDSLQGTVQEDTELTIGSSADIVITNHVQYESYTPGSGTPGTVGYVPPSVDSADNLLGLVSWGGNVRVGTGAPNDINIHGTVMSQNGVMTVDDYNNTSVGPRGTATLLGGVISDDYGAFGLFNSSTGLATAGYGRNFVYDQRMLAGKAPPYFPSLDTFIAFTNDITDKLVWQEGQ